LPSREQPTDSDDSILVDNNSLYTQPEDIYDIYKALSAVSPYFSIAAGFGNVHGVYVSPRLAVYRPMSTY
jgi:fructose/tagatose bisphosphate aldolase